MRFLAPVASLLALVTPPAHAESVKAPPVAAEHARYAAEIGAAQATLDAFMAAWNARDSAALDATFNYPSVRFASNTVTVLQPGWLTAERLSTGALAEWDHSEWARRDVIHAGPDKVHVNTRFNRFRKDGSLISGFDSIYIVTKVNGHWGIQGRSSFAP